MATLTDLERAVQTRFPGVSAQLQLGELTFFADAAQLVDLLTFARDDAELACDLLADLSGVHWPAGELVIEGQPSTSGWPQYRVTTDVGRIEVNYILRSTSLNHWFRIAVAVSDEDGHVPTATELFPTANYHEREVFDFFGVVFDGHPDLTRILMPEDWIGHPQRKDYPLGGVAIEYHNDKFIPSPEDRDLREVIS